MRNEERARDLAGGQTSETTKDQRDTVVGSQCRVGTREEQFESFVGQFVAARIRGAAPLDVDREFGQTLRVDAVAAYPVECPATGGGEQPRARPIGHPADRPVHECRLEGVRCGFLGQVQIAETVHQRREKPPVLLAEHRFGRDTRIGHG